MQKMPPKSINGGTAPQFRSAKFSELYFPAQNWRFVRESKRLEETPDAFLWACSFPQKSTKHSELWAWHPKGTLVTNGYDDRVIPLHVMKVGSELEAFGLFLKTSFSAESPIEIEWVNALHVLEQHFKYDFSSKKLPPYWEFALTEAGLEPHLSSLTEHGKFVGLTLEESQFIYQKKWEPSVFELALSLTDEVRGAILEVIKRFGISAIHSKEVFNWALLLSKKFSPKSALDIIAQKKFQSGDELRVSLFNVAQPELSRLSELRIDKLRRLYLPPRTSVFGDPSFENDTLKITHTPRSVSDWEAFKEWVERSEVTAKIKDLLDLYQ